MKQSVKKKWWNSNLLKRGWKKGANLMRWILVSLSWQLKLTSTTWAPWIGVGSLLIWRTVILGEKNPGENVQERKSFKRTGKAWEEINAKAA
jgi:hypothetical protein